MMGSNSEPLKTDTHSDRHPSSDISADCLLDSNLKGTLTKSSGARWLPSNYDGNLDSSMDFVRTFAGVTRRGKASKDPDRVKKTFKRWDADGDGKISKAEMYQIFHELDKRFTREIVEKMFAAADANRDGAILYDEFIQWLFR